MRYKVRYWRRCIEWDEKACPYAVDTKTGIEVAHIHQFVSHLGEYDAEADRIANIIVKALNEAEETYNEDRNMISCKANDSKS